MEVLFNLILEIKKLFEKRDENKKNFFKNYIAPTYCDAKQIYIDLKTILQQAKDMLLDQTCDYNRVVEHLKEARLPLQSSREELRSRTFIITNKVEKDTDLFMFALSIRGILCGGMTGEFFQFNIDTINSYINGLSIGHELCFYEGNHTLLDLIDRFDIKDSDQSNRMTSNNLQIFRRIFLSEVEKQQISLDQYFRLLVNSYEKIKWEVYSSNV